MLKKDLGMFQVFSIAAGAMISSGLFVLPGIVFATVGPAVTVAYFIAGMMMIPTMLAQAELATAMPKSGGSYFYIERSLGSLLGTMAGLTDWLSLSLKAAFALVGIGALASFFGAGLGPWATKGVAAAACLLFGAVNIMGAKDAGRFQVWLVVGLLGILVGFVALGIGKVDAARFHPFMVSGVQSVIGTAGMVFVSYGGLTKVTAVSEEIRDPGKNIPRGMFLAFFTVNFIYLVVLVVVVGTVEPQRLAGSLVPLNLSAEAVSGRWISWALSLAAFLAFATTANAGILSASRSPMAMSRDGLLPAFLAKTHPRFGTPVSGILLTVTFMVAAILFLPLDVLVKTASTMMILMFILVNASLLVVRRARLPAYRPSFRAPLYPWLPIGAILVYGFLVVEMGIVPLVLTGMFALFSMAWYLGYVWRRIDRESAFVHLVKRVTAREVRRPGFEAELRQIALQRDEQELDWFDHLVKSCVRPTGCHVGPRVFPPGGRQARSKVGSIS